MLDMMKLENNFLAPSFWMATYSLFGFHFLLSCFMLLVLAAVQGEEDSEKCSSKEPKCRLQISGCEDKNAVKKIKLGDNHWYGIDTIVNIPESEYSSIFIHKNGVFPSETLKPPTSFSINNNITFHICTLHPINQTMSLFTSCSSYNIYYNSASDHPLPMLFLPVGCLPTRFLHIPTTPSCTIFFSLLEIRVELPPSCKQCSPPQCQVNFQGQYPTCSPPNPPPAKPKAKKIGLYVGIPCSVAVVALIVLLLYRQRNKYSGLKNQPRSASSSSFRESGAVYFGIPIFSYEELRKATYNFDQAMELGEGGFGTVYYGKLRDGREVAVKRLFERNYRPVEPFTNEIKILTRLKHRNLVSLYGCTSRHSRELLLVYEYIPNGTVSSHLHGDQATLRSLPWPLRMKIAIETASALAYLHASDIIHRDVKTSNILLDNDFGVKVADFGLSRLFPDDATHVSTVPRGTPGYVDPEYRLCYQLTTKSDVYSFGVVLVELISSLKAIDMNRRREDIKLANLAIRKIQKGAFCELVDPFLDFQSDEKLKSMIVSVAELAFQCLQGDKELRPSIGEVLEVLQRIQNGRDEPGNLEGIVVHGPTRASQSLAHSPLPNTLKMPQPRLHHTH